MRILEALTPTGSRRATSRRTTKTGPGTECDRVDAAPAPRACLACGVVEREE